MNFYSNTGDTNMDTQTPTVGYISFTMIDQVNNVVLELGGAGFTSQERLESEWDSIPALKGETVFIADKQDQEGSSIDERDISESTIVSKLGEPINILIHNARKAALSLD